MTVLRLDEGQDIPHNTERVLPGVSIILIKDGRWALAEVCTLLTSSKYVSTDRLMQSINGICLTCYIFTSVCAVW